MGMGGRLCLSALLIASGLRIPTTSSTTAPRTPPCSRPAAATAYLSALSQQNYNAMWRLLAPPTRAAWGTARSYGDFLAARFGPTVHWSLHSALPTPLGTTFSVHFRLPSARASLTQTNLLASFPLVINRACQVSDGGPTAPGAPTLLPNPLAHRQLMVPILMYHHISSQPAIGALGAGLTVSDAAFTSQMAYLAAHHYHTILLPQLMASLEDGLPLPDHPVVLTFDDGYRDNYTDALPILRHYHMVAEFAIITAFVGAVVGTNTYMTWPQLRALVGSGMEIESHSVDHQDLSYVTDGVARNEVRYAQATLRQQLGIPAQFFTYPAGDPFRVGTLGRQDLLRQLLAQYGYGGALLDPITPAIVESAAHPFELPRVRVAPNESLALFAARLTGADMFVL